MLVSQGRKPFARFGLIVGSSHCYQVEISGQAAVLLKSRVKGHIPSTSPSALCR